MTVVFETVLNGDTTANKSGTVTKRKQRFSGRGGVDVAFPAEAVLCYLYHFKTNKIFCIFFEFRMDIVFS